MDIDDGDFVARARAWLAEHAPRFENIREAITKSPSLTADEQAEVVRRAREWEAHKAAAGYAGISLPADLGGHEHPVAHELAFAIAESDYDLPHDVTAVTKGMVVPTLLRWGSPDQRNRYVPPTLDGRELWCQMFSEPEAGSDLAAVGLRAQRSADGWQLSGRKVWTSYGTFADWGYLLARTDPDVPKHKGLTTFLVDMAAAGIEASPLRQATGGATFSEVLFDRVRVPDAQRLGPVGEGWRVALTTLMHERMSIDAASVPWKKLARLASTRTERFQDRGLRTDLMRVYATFRALRLLKESQLSAYRDGRLPGPESSASKVLAARAAHDSARLANRVLGAEALVDGPWQEFLIGMPGLAIGGGAEDILMTVIAERVLGLPAEPRADSGTWRELRQSGRLN